ncbi:MAG: hypothetical protein ACYC5X_04075 [Syntrophales bacterium]
MKGRIGNGWPSFQTTLCMGVKTRLEVEDAEFNLRQAKSSLSRERRDYIVARVNLDWVTGILGEGRENSS